MKSHGRIVAIVLGSALFACALIMAVAGGCGNRSDKITIGVVGPITGEGATYGASMKRGFDLAFQGVPQVKLVYEDDKLTPSEGVAAIMKLISIDKVQVVLGSAASGVTLAMAPIAEKNKVILFSSISTSDDLKKAGQYIFRNVPRNEVQGITAARFVVKQVGKSKVAILLKNDAYATNLSKSFKKEIQDLGAQVVFEEAYQPDTRDFRSILAKMASSSPEAVYIPGNYQETAVLLVQARELGITSVFVGGDGSYSPELLKLAGDAAEGSYFTIMGFNHNGFYEKFLSEFHTKYNKEPDVYDAYAYEAGMLVRQALDSVGNSATKIKDFLLSTTFEQSLTGPLQFDADGEVDRQYSIVAVKNGRFVDAELKI